MSEPQEPIPERATFLPVLLASMAGFFCLLVLLLLTGGFFFYLVLFVGCIVGVASLHWLVWGKLLTQLTAGEREEAVLRQRAEELHERARAGPQPEEIRFRR